MMQWLSMGGYWPYVWPSYGLALLVIWANIHWAIRSHREARRDARRRMQMKGEQP